MRRPRTVSDAGEFESIRLMTAKCARPGPEVSVGPGDDSAAFKPRAGRRLLVTADMLVEGVHFDLGFAGWRDLGYKAIAANMSDIAAMGGRPLYYLVSLGLRGDEKLASAKELYKGMEEAARPFGVKLLGGDTVRSPWGVVISVTVIGEAAGKKILTRSGARPGDEVYVTGTLGDSAAGLEILKAAAGAGARRPRGYLVERHLRPIPRVAAGLALARTGLVTAMIDTSDGLSSDLSHILEQSGCGVRLEADALPVSRELVRYAGRERALDLALSGGEDYELIFTAPPGPDWKLRKALSGTGTPLTRVGVITEKTGRSALKPGGYEHFRI